LGFPNLRLRRNLRIAFFQAFLRLVAAAALPGLQIFWHFALETELVALYYYSR
jgi:hypothetical protein